MRWSKWLPLATSTVVVAAILLAAQTSPADIAKYLAYGAFAVTLPGTLVYRALRRTPHTLVEDIAMGAALGLVLELAGWAVFSLLDLRAVIWLWPLLVIVPFAAVPGLRRHWIVRDYASTAPPGWSWTLAAIVVFFAAYLFAVFYAENPIIPDTESTRQFLDLPYQLSLAGEATHRLPPDVPQVAGEPLNYHWFAFVHLAMTGMVGHIDLPVVTMRLMVLGICALTAILTAVVGWRLSGRRWVGIAAAAMFFVIGEFDFAAAGWPPFGSQATFVVWPSLSMTYSWALLVACIGVAGGILIRRADGKGAYVLLALFALASSAAKGSSLPVVAAALAFAGVAVLVTTRRIPWAIVTSGAIVVGAQLVAMAVIFKFQRYGVRVEPFSELRPFWTENLGDRGTVKQAAVVTAVWVAFLLHLQLRAAGIIAVLWLRRLRLDPVQWFLLGGALAGPAIHVMLRGYASTWFTRAGFPFSVILSAWGYALLYERSKVDSKGRVVLGAGAAAFAVALTAISLAFGYTTYPSGHSYSQMLPILQLAAALVAFGVVAAGAWWVLRGRIPALRGRGWLVVLTAVLLAGAPGLFLDAKASWGVQGGPYGAWTAVPASQVQAARWVRGNTAPTDVIATNSHCANSARECESAESFWVSAYTERSTLLEGWSFAPRWQAGPTPGFWDQTLYQLNEDAFYAPTAEKLRLLHDRYRVRYLIAVRTVAPESEQLAGLAERRFDNGRVAVYELAG